MKKLLLIIFCCLPAFVVAQKLPDAGTYKIHLTDSGQTIIAEINVASDEAAKPELYYYWYATNNIHITQGGFSGKLLNGTYQELYANKNLKQQGNFKNGLKNKEWKMWNTSGLLVSVYNWEKGIMAGEFRLYDGSGKLTKLGIYKNGRLNGTLLSYSSKDSVTAVNYVNGEINPNPKRSLWFKINPLRLFDKPKVRDTVVKH